MLNVFFLCFQKKEICIMKIINRIFQYVIMCASIVLCVLLLYQTSSRHFLDFCICNCGMDSEGNQWFSQRYNSSAPVLLNRKNHAVDFNTFWWWRVSAKRQTSRSKPVTLSDYYKNPDRLILYCTSGTGKDFSLIYFM